MIPLALFGRFTLLVVGNVDQYFDITALVVVFVIAFLYSLGVGGDEICIQKFGHGIV